MEERILTNPVHHAHRTGTTRQQRAQLPSMGEGAVGSLTTPAKRDDQKRAELAALEAKIVQLTNQVARNLNTNKKDAIFDLLSKKKYRILVQRDSGITVDQFSKMIEKELSLGFNKQQSHAAWLAEPTNIVGITPHEVTLNPRFADVFGHYNEFDDHMIWRFTSKPSEELVYITEGTKNEEITRVIAAHSAGNDKRNPNVNTLSFARNLAALKGTAASIGGDQHVTNIIDKAEYLYGIDIRTLAEKGISAHPATARDISFFESEYVLINSPGHSPYTLEELATTRMDNPFKGQAFNDVRVVRNINNSSNEARFNELKARIEEEMYKEDFIADVIPVEIKEPFLEGQVSRLKAYFEASAISASAQYPAVQSKESAALRDTQRFMKKYQENIKAHMMKAQRK